MRAHFDMAARPPRTPILLTTLAAMLAMAPAASAELRAGTAKDPVGDAQTAGIEFSQAKDLVQVDARYDAKGGDIIVDATMAGDVPLRGRHSFMSFTTLEFTAKISNGRYSVDEKLDDQTLAGMIERRGVVHSYTLFTGYLPARMRGEMRSYQVLGNP